MDCIMWTLIGIFIYLAIGYMFVLYFEAYEDGFWVEVRTMLFWFPLILIFVICVIYFGWKELYEKYFNKRNIRL